MDGDLHIRGRDSGDVCVRRAEVQTAALSHLSLPRRQDPSELSADGLTILGGWLSRLRWPARKLDSHSNERGASEHPAVLAAEN